MNPEDIVKRRQVRERMLARIEKLGGTDYPEPGYVIDSDETDDTSDDVFCWEHAQIVVHGDAILTGCEMFPINVSHGEADHEQWCTFHGCSKALNTGSPTDNWIDSALGLTEEDPYAVSVTPYELSRSYWNMQDDDKRWTIWMRQAKRVLIKARANDGEAGR